MPPRRLALLTHPGAGRGRGARVREVVLSRLRRAGFDVLDLVGADVDEARDLARTACAADVETLVALGGDGTVHLALQQAVPAGVTLAVVPAGTGNDLARELGIPADPVAAADRVVAGRTREIDVLQVGDRYVATVLACGFDALVAERADAMAWPRGRSRYVAAVAAELRALAPRRYTLELDGTVREVDGVLAAVGNTASFGGGLRITEGAEPDDGLLDVVVIRTLGRRELVRAFPRLYRGTHTDHRAYEHHRARSVTVAARGITAYGDGEPLGRLPLTISALPRAVKVVV
ncbi:YegS/Rv2252/BmrU family lipid kinase [Nocardioides zeae]|uniref:YegS/Rv2252/BmrU family lipid kinase n=1 Tax=Nocardioides imazamoxiresistens TaxID=3231893 RepID=A0ABU3PSX3_9ACTN|nr:YegS/Rv2252/BmrU family lipid kinase [Nocardioides zeae]MDT9592327.1 YegS/Rv2252/BmrU family lipid kinase [Nocardioides zeae]